jgi:hypothetical protein
MKGDDHLEQLLDRALEATFPASDPIALSFASPERPIDAAGTDHDGSLADRL